MNRIKLAVLLSLLIGLVPATASASSQSFYPLNNSSKTGMLVSLTSNPKVVAPAVSSTAKSLVGVVAGSSDASVDQQPGQISVSVDGVASALVSTEAGNIAVGDQIAPSDIAGVGDKLTGSGWIVGTAQASVNPSTSGAVKIATNSHKTAYVANIPLVVKVVYFTAPGSNSQQASWIPQSLRTVANYVAGKKASTTAVVLSFVLILAGLFLTGLIINSAIRGGMLAISRQPLAKSSISGKIFQSFGIALVIIIAMLLGAVILLRVL